MSKTISTVRKDTTQLVVYVLNILGIDYAPVNCDVFDLGNGWVLGVDDETFSLYHATLEPDERRWPLSQLTLIEMLSHWMASVDYHVKRTEKLRGANYEEDDD